MTDLDHELLSAIRASAPAAPPRKKVGKSCQLVAVTHDDEPVRAAADKSKLVLFSERINTRAAQAA